MPKKIAFLTAGGLALCFSSSIGGLIEKYDELAPEAELVGYRNGYQGLLLGNSMPFVESVKASPGGLYKSGGSPIANSWVKLTNVEDCVKRKLVEEGENPLEVDANRLKEDGIDILYTIGGDDTDTTAADLAAYLEEHHGYGLTVVGLLKTVENDVFPIKQTLEPPPSPLDKRKESNGQKRNFLAIYWDDYEAAYEDALSQCHSGAAPWFVIHANRKWYRNLVISRIIVGMTEGPGIELPEATVDNRKYSQEVSPGGRGGKEGEQMKRRAPSRRCKAVMHRHETPEFMLQDFARRRIDE